MLSNANKVNIWMRSKIYRDLTPKKLDQVSVDDIDQLRSMLYAQGRKNKVAYDELQQVALAANQQGGSGSIPKSSTIVSVNNIYDNKSPLYNPSTGTWMLESIEFQVTGGTGKYTHVVFLAHSNGAEMIAFFDERDASEVVAIRTEIEIDENITIYAITTGGGGAPTDVTAYAYLMRRR